MLSNSAQQDAKLRRGARLALAATSLFMLCGEAAQAQTRDIPTVAWGKANISYDQYRDDALECGKVGLAADIDHSDPVNTLRTASTEMDALYDRTTYLEVSRDGGTSRQGSYNAANAEIAAREHDRQAIEMAAQPKTQYARIKDLMFVEVRKCMAAHGFSRFTLTEAQRAEMGALKDKASRRQYLYKLSSDPDVLDKQKYIPTP